MAEDLFGRRLRSERERRTIALEAIAANTKISINLLKALERDDFSRWPSGVFRRSFMRSYAEAIGLDAEATVREFLERFPDPLEGADAVFAAVTADGKPRPTASATTLRLTLAEPPPRFSGGRLLAGLRVRVAAAAIDLAVMAGLGLLMFLFVGAFWAPFAVAMIAYYGGAILLLGNTPGVCLVAPRSASDDIESLSDEPITLDLADASAMGEPATAVGRS